jgi:hypothetical protein
MANPVYFQFFDLIKSRIRLIFDNFRFANPYAHNKKYIHNFANIYGGATILEKHPDLENSDNVIQDNRDK